MKRIITIIMTLIMLMTSAAMAKAEEYEDMTPWNFIMLTDFADNGENVKVSKFINIKTGQIAFCLEPEVLFSPKGHEYVKKQYEEDNADAIRRIYDAYMKCDQNDNDLYIAAQLMIWEEITGIRYIFDGNDASFFGEETIKLNMVSSKKATIPLHETINIKRDETNEYRNENIDLSNYNILCDSIEVISIDKDGFTFRLVDEDNMIIYLKPKAIDGFMAVAYKAEGTQNIYSLEESKIESAPINIEMELIDDYIDISFCKKDLSGNSIKGAEFSLYRIDDRSDNRILFIDKGYAIDLYSFLNVSMSDYEILLSERYRNNLKDRIFSSNEIGYFTYDVLSNGESIENGKVYISDDDELTEGSFNSVGVELIAELKTADGINTFKDVANDGKYLLIESNPANGYEYYDCIGKIIDLDDGNELKDLIFLNEEREYDLHLIKSNSSKNIYLNGAEFILKYQDNDDEMRSFHFVTGALNIANPERKRYIHFRYDEDDLIHTYEIEDEFILENVEPGLYHYCLNDESSAYEDDLNRRINVIDGGYEIKGIPYFTMIQIEEIKAPKGYHIENGIYQIHADMEYNEIVFKNYRVNEAIIIPKKDEFIIPKTCIDE